ncbi:MAG: hypothetical protein KatS3mg125_1359 [Lysobacterales bacterium]|jgi:outer membrane autotransporter protein|nr:MAG: hypothetical protein KatS3mg125_1359 [Xanthomonadales bacterium]
MGRRAKLSRPPARGYLLLVLCAALSLLAKPDPVRAQAPQPTLVLVSGDGQKGLPGSALAQPLVVQALLLGNPLVSVPVLFTITQDETGGASIPLPSVNTNSLGRASASLTLGPQAGTVRVCAQLVVTTPPAPVCFIATAAWPKLKIVAGNGQNVPPFSPFAPLIVGLDEDQPLPATTTSVLWEVVAGQTSFPGGAQSVVTPLPLGGTASASALAGAGPSSVRIRASLPAFPLASAVEFQLQVSAPASAQLIRISGDQQSALINSPFAQPLVVRALSGGQPVSNLPVEWDVVSGPVVFASGGTNAVSFTNSDGIARIDLRAGATAGRARIRASAAGFASVEFEAVVIAPDEQIEIVSGDGQVAPIGSLSERLVVRVYALPSGAALPDRRVEWTVEQGSATLSTPVSFTDGSGLADVRFVFGTPGPIAIRARLAGSPRSVLFRAESLGPRLILVGGDGQVGRVGETLSQPLVVRLVADSGSGTRPIAGEAISWRILQGGGNLAASSTPTASDGRAENRLTLPSQPGTVLVEASAPTAGSVVFRAEARSFLPDDLRLEIVSGNGQSLTPNSPSQPLVVRAVDRQGRPLPGVGLRWSATPAEAVRFESTETRTGSEGTSSNVVRVLEPISVTVRVEVFDPPGASASVNFSLSAALAQTPGLNPPERDQARGFDRLCQGVANLPSPDPRQAELRELCRRLSEEAGADPQRLRSALATLITPAPLAGGRLALQAASAQLENLKQRLMALRGGERGVSVNGLSLVDGGNALPLSLVQAILWPAATSEESDAFSRWGLFLTGTVGRGRRDPSAQETGFRFDEWSLTGGVDYRLTDQLFIGGALGYNATETRLGRATGRIDATTRSLAVYLSWNGETSYLEGVLTRATNRLDQERQLQLNLGQGANVLAIDQRFASEAEGRQTGLFITGGYDFNRGALSFGPYLRATWLRQRIDAHRERALRQDRPGAALAVAVAAQRIESRQLTAGARAQYIVPFGAGVLIPTAQIEWTREYEDDAHGLVIRFLHDPSAASFVLRGDRFDRSFANLGLGVSAVLSGGRSGYMFYERTVGLERERREQLSLGLRFEF